MENNILGYFFYFVLVLLLMKDCEQRKETKKWKIILIIAPILTPIYILGRSKLETDSIISNKTKFFIGIGFLINMIFFLYEFIRPMGLGSSADVISQSTTLGLFILFNFVLLSIPKRDFALSSLGIMVALFIVLAFLMSSANKTNYERDEVILYEDGILYIRDVNNEDVSEVTLDKISEIESPYLAIEGKDTLKIKKSTGRYYKNRSLKPFTGYYVFFDNNNNISKLDSYEEGISLETREINNNGYIDSFFFSDNRENPELGTKTKIRTITYEDINNSKKYSISKDNKEKNEHYEFSMDENNKLLNGAKYYKENKLDYQIEPLNGKLDVNIVDWHPNNSNPDMFIPYVLNIKEGLVTSYYENGNIAYKEKIVNRNIYDTKYYNYDGIISGYTNTEINGDNLSTYTIEYENKKIMEIESKGAGLNFYGNLESCKSIVYCDYVSTDSTNGNDGKFEISKFLGCEVEKNALTLEINDLYFLKKEIEYKGEKYLEYYNLDKKISIKILNGNMINPDKVYISISDNKFYIEKQKGSFIINAEFDKKYHPLEKINSYNFS